MTDTATTALGAALVVLDLVAVVRAVSRDHGVERTLAWIFAILALPGVGALAYLAFASPSVRRTTRRKLQSAAAAGRGAGAAGPPTPLPPDASDAARTLFRLAARVTELAPTGGNEVRLLVRSEEAFARIEGAIRGARESVFAEYFMVRNDATGRRFLELLTEKATEGIDVRFIYDAIGSITLDAGRLRALETAGGKVAEFLPLNPLRKRWAVHLRNHRKLIVVDGSTVFTGGMNIGDEYSGRSRRAGEQHFHDTHLEVRGPAARPFGQVFAEDWAFATDVAEDVAPSPEELESPGSAAVAVLPSGPDQDHNASWLVYLAAMGAADRRVFLATPYFIPDPALEAAIACAALRGIDVRVLVPEHCDVRLAAAAARSYYRPMLRAGVRIWHYQPAMLHAKTLIVDDDVAVVGSANADIRSFRLNFEIGALVGDADFVAQAERSFLADLEQSREVTLDEVLGRPAVLRLADSTARLLSPLL